MLERLDARAMRHVDGVFQRERMHAKDLSDLDQRFGRPQSLDVNPQPLFRCPAIEESLQLFDVGDRLKLGEVGAVAREGDGRGASVGRRGESAWTRSRRWVVLLEHSEPPEARVGESRLGQFVERLDLNPVQDAVGTEMVVSVGVWRGCGGRDAPSNRLIEGCGAEADQPGSLPRQIELRREAKRVGVLRGGVFPQS